MLQIYNPENKNFEMNGDANLNPISCILNMTLNGSWEVVMEHPIDEKLNFIVENAVICGDTPVGKKQLFRINDIEKNNDTISCVAYPIFFDSKNDCFLFDVRPTEKNGQDALNIMLAPNAKYNAESNISKIATSYYVQKNFMEALNGSDENSFINRWGGEILFNNYKITVNDKIGADNGLRVEFGFNLSGINEKIDMSNVVTRIIPKAYNGHLLPNNETVDSPNINKYPVVYTKVIEYENIKLKEDASSDNSEDDGIIICENLNELYEELRAKAKKEFENDIDLPAITYDVDIIDLSRTELYKDYKELLKVNLGDVAHIKHRRLNITTTARVTSLEYDMILNKIDSLTLGDYQNSYFDNMDSILNSAENVINISNNTLMAEKIKGVINLLNTSLKAQKDIAKKQDVRAILFEDLDKESPTFGALCIGTQGLQIAKKRNTSDTDWQWGTAIDFQTIYANYIIAGTMSDKVGNNYWDLDKGELVTKNMKASNAEISGTIKSSRIEGSNISGGTINIDTALYVGNNIYLKPTTAGDYFAINMNNKTVLRVVGSSNSTSSLDGDNVQLLAGNHIYLSANTISASTSISTSSDKRIKENIKEIDLSNLIDMVKVKKFDYIKGKNNVIGVIAQDLLENEFSNYLITKDEKTGLLSVDYNALAMACIQKVQNLEKRISILEERRN